MPFKKGLDFIEEQVKKGCKCKHIALMSGDFTDEDISKSKTLGIKIFRKPFQLSEIINWLNQIERDIDKSLSTTSKTQQVGDDYDKL